MSEPRWAKRRMFLRKMVKLSPLERKAVEGVLQGKSQTQAMLDAGYSEGMSHKQQKRVFERDRVQGAIVAAMEDMGVDVERLVMVLRDGLGAERVMVSKNGGRLSTPDHAVRHKFLQTALELRGDYPVKEERQITETYEERIFRLRGIPQV
jgi:hypothetical protein